MSFCVRFRYKHGRGHGYPDTFPTAPLVNAAPESSPAVPGFSSLRRFFKRRSSRFVCPYNENSTAKPSSGPKNFCDLLQLGMAAGAPEDISGLLLARSNGDEAALNDVMPLAYDDLRGIAWRRLRQSPGGILTYSGALAHQAYRKLVQARGIRCRNRACCSASAPG